MASHFVARADGYQFRFLDGADGFGFKTAGMKPAPRGRIKGTGDFTRQDDRLVLNVWTGRQSGRIKRLGIGMDRIPVNLRTPGNFNNLAQIHDPDAVAQNSVITLPVKI
jgi:hypothetical protein